MQYLVVKSAENARIYWTFGRFYAILDIVKNAKETIIYERIRAGKNTRKPHIRTGAGKQKAS
jgi:hypothetical protein